MMMEGKRQHSLIHLHCVVLCCVCVCVWQGESLLNGRSKEQELELTRQTLAALGEMRIRFPGKSEEEAEAVLNEVRLCAVVSAVSLCCSE